jgi:hypothetical protein
MTCFKLGLRVFFYITFYKTAKFNVDIMFDLLLQNAYLSAVDLPFGVNSIWSQYKFHSRTRRRCAMFMYHYLSIVSKLSSICIYTKSMLENKERRDIQVTTFLLKSNHLNIKVMNIKHVSIQSL